MLKANNLKLSFLLLMAASLLALNVFKASAEPVENEAQNKLLIIKSDSSQVDLTNQIIIYRGNASFDNQDIKILGEQIKAQKNQGLTREVFITGSPAILTKQQKNTTQKTIIQANNIEYHLETKKMFATDNVLLLQQNTIADSFQVKADKLNITPAPSNLFIFEGSPLKLTIEQPNQPPLTANANEMIFDPITKQFELTDNVSLITENEIIKAYKIIYNSQTRVIQIPPSQQQVEMTQTKKKNDE